MRADVLGCYRGTDNLTPNIDKLGKQGIIFEHVISVSPWTVPAHFSMFTGLYPTKHQMNIPYNKEEIYDKLTPLSKDIKTLAEIFKEKGYRCAAFTGGGFVQGKFGFARGFDEYLNDCSDIKMGIHYLKEWLSGGNWQQGIFFVFLHTFSAHSPFRDSTYIRAHSDDKAYREFTKKSEQLYLSRTGEVQFSKREINDIWSFYKDSVMHIDQQIGDLIGYLNEVELLDNTVIILTSDHGQEFHEHGSLFHGHTLYNEQLTIPLVFIGSNIKKGYRCKELASNIDIFQTLCDIIDYEADSDGLSLFEIAQGATERRFIFSEATHGLELKSLTSKEYKLIYNSKPGEYPFVWKENDRQWQFYDLSRDYREQYNLAGQNSEECEIMKQALLDIIQKNQLALSEKETVDFQLEVNEIERLKSLGYVN